MFFFGFSDPTQAVGRLETEAIGETCGKATSVLSDGVGLVTAFIRELLAVYTGHIRRWTPPLSESTAQPSHLRRLSQAQAPFQFLARPVGKDLRP